MFNKIIATLNGHGSEAASLEAAILQLGRDRDEARARIDELQKKRHQALLDDASDADLDKLERQLDRALTRLEKLNLAEPPLLERLTGARSVARQRRWGMHLDCFHAAAAEFIPLARATIEKHSELIAIVAQAQREGFSGEVAATMPTTPHVNGAALLAPDLLDIFERAIAPPVRRAAAPPPRPAKTAAVVWKTSRENFTPLPPGTTSLQHAVSLGPADSVVRLTAQRAADDDSVLLPGESRVLALHSGWCPRDNAEQTHAGQRLKMPASAAQAAANRGQVEILEEFTAPAPAAEAAPTQEAPK